MKTTLRTLYSAKFFRQDFISRIAAALSTQRGVVSRARPSWFRAEDIIKSDRYFFAIGESAAEYHSSLGRGRK